jgi:hypothetical protein
MINFNSFYGDCSGPVNKKEAEDEEREEQFEGKGRWANLILGQVGITLMLPRL